VPSTRFQTEIVARTAVSVAFTGFDSDGRVQRPAVTVATTAPDEVEAATREVREGGSSRRRWDEKSFLAALASEGEEAEPGIKRLLAFAKLKAGALTWGTGRTYGTFNFKVTVGPKTMALLTADSTGWIQVQFVYMAGLATDETLARLAHDLTAVPGFPPLRDHDFANYWPRVPGAVLAQDGAWKAFESAIVGFQFAICPK
jgi:hypothetical protein